MIKEFEARTILWIIVFTGFGVNCMVRTNINIVLVDVVNPSTVGNTTFQSACGNVTVQSTEQTASLAKATSRRDERFDWNEREQNVVLGAYFWLNWLTQIPGGLLARTFGTKLLFGIGNGVPVLLTFLAPLAASCDYRTLTALRLLQGIFSMATPWLSIIMSVPVWMIVVAQWAGTGALFTFQTQIPTYFRNVHGWDVRAIGMISGIPLIARMVVAIGFSTYCDYLLRKNSMSRTKVRKLATGVGTIGQSILVVGVAMSGCDAWTATLCIVMASVIHGAVSGGPLSAIIDISPNFAGVLGMSGVVTVLPGFISPIVVGYITYQNQTVSAWGKVFGIVAGQLLLCGILYVAFGSTELQPWNSPKSVCQTNTANRKKEEERKSREETRI